MGETADIQELEATIATLCAQLEATSRDNEALAADNRELADEASRLATRLADKDAELVELAARKDRAYAQLKGEHDRLVELIKQANARAFGAKSERVLPHQISLFNDVEAAAAPQAAAPEAAPTRKRRRPKRKVDWSRFKTTVVTHELPEGERDCPACGHHMEPMGHELRREFVYVPARIEVREHRVAKYVCRACSEANEASGGERPASIVQAKGP